MLKIDYRIIESIECCGDDHDYYMHSETIAIDRDLDYSNQLMGNEESRFSSNNKIAPIGFIGSGLLAAPFLFIGNIFDEKFLNWFGDYQTIFNFKILFYSLSAIFYFYLTFVLILKSTELLNLKYKKFKISLIFLGSGVSYYAFERYSMTHVYEGFIFILIFYLSLKFYLSEDKKSNIAFYIPILVAIGISVRWVNYFFFLIPFFSYSFLIKRFKVHNLLRSSPRFYLSTLISTVLFFIHTKVLYGQFTFNPQFVYGTSGNINKYLDRSDSFFSFLYETVKNSLVVLFTQEFGLFWFSPILFFGFIYVLISIFLNNGYNFIFKILLFLSFAQVFVVVLMWKSTASSYGFRYLFCLIPISIILFLDFQSLYDKKFVSKYIIIFSYFSFFSILFFETTIATQLSLDPVINSFGNYSRYSQPNYLIGYVNSFLNIESYLKIFTTSFLGAIIFKLFIAFLGYSNLVSLLSSLGLPADNNDFNEYLININEIFPIKFFIILIFFSLLYYHFINLKEKI